MSIVKLRNYRLLKTFYRRIFNIDKFAQLPTFLIEAGFTVGKPFFFNHSANPL